MKLFKPEYNENVVDVDALEKLRIQQEGETERNLILQQELTKREAVKQKEDTKRGSGYTDLRTGLTIGGSIVLIIASIGGSININNYLDVLKARVELQKMPLKCPDVPECPKVTCQAIQAK